MGLVGALGCSLEEPDLDLGAACEVNGDCSEALVCIQGHCHQRCQTSASCPQGNADGSEVSSSCVHIEGTSACLLPTEQACSTEDGSCPEGLVCAADGLCRNDCAISRDCVSGQTCTQGMCVEPEEESPDAGEPDEGGVPDDGSTGEEGVGEDAGEPDSGGGIDD
jgi:hypothetical protein